MKTKKLATHVIGLIFSKNLKYIYLIRKNRPKEQIGLLNGVGGKVEKNETSYQAMKREAWEEAKYIGSWNRIGKINKVDVYTSIMNSNSSEPITQTDETIERWELIEIQKNSSALVPGIYEFIKGINICANKKQ